jgi:hypothetical protein
MSLRTTISLTRSVAAACLKPDRAPQPARSVLRQLRDFPTLPHLVIFIDESWRFWQQIPTARERFQSCVRISVKRTFPANLWCTTSCVLRILDIVRKFLCSR